MQKHLILLKKGNWNICLSGSLLWEVLFATSAKQQSEMKWSHCSWDGYLSKSSKPPIEERLLVKRKNTSTWTIAFPSFGLFYQLLFHHLSLYVIWPDSASAPSSHSTALQCQRAFFPPCAYTHTCAHSMQAGFHHKRTLLFIFHLMTQNVLPHSTKTFPLLIKRSGHSIIPLFQ